MEFENMTIKQLRLMTEEFKNLNPDVKPVQELLDEINQEKE